MSPRSPYKIYKLLLFNSFIAILSSSAGIMTASLTKPVIDEYDVYNLEDATALDKWWPDNSVSSSAKGQLFQTGPASYKLESITYKLGSGQIATGNKVYRVRLGKIEGDTFTELYSEWFTQDFTWNGDEYMTWTLDLPQLLNGNTTYGVDVGFLSSSTSWQTGIPYVSNSADNLEDSNSYRSGTQGMGADVIDQSVNVDRIFHLDLAPPLLDEFIFISGYPVDDTSDVLIPQTLTATFSKILSMGAGNITVKNLTLNTEVTFPITDPKVTLEGNLLTINAETLIEWGNDYAVNIEPAALTDDSGDNFTGFVDDTSWNFSMANDDPLIVALDAILGAIKTPGSVSNEELTVHRETIHTYKNRFDQNAETITAALAIVSTYDAEVGALWLVGADRYYRSSQENVLLWTVYDTMQLIMDEVYNHATIQKHGGLLYGYSFGSSAHFPGAVAPPTNINAAHMVSINGSFTDTFGRDTQQWTLPARKPTGTYLAPGSFVRVQVPESLVGKGYLLRVGAHSWDLSSRPYVERLDRATIAYPIDNRTMLIASPYGGGIYVEVPMGADAGVVSLSITGAVRSPYYSAKDFHQTTLEEWLETERTNPAPWADFQSDKFMMQLPRDWIYKLEDPVTLLKQWDKCMDAMNDLMGFPRVRGKETMYLQPDVILRSSVHAPGYPAVNIQYDPKQVYNGEYNWYYTLGPQAGAHIEFHEQGHAYFFPKFAGERESAVNLHYATVMNAALGYDVDTAFSSSLGFEGNPHRSLDNTALAWMTTFNYSPGEREMHTGEKSYQLKGHAKYMDIAQLFGWEGLGKYWKSLQVNEESGQPVPTTDDEMIIRLCETVGVDLRPLLEFWGILIDDPSTVEAAVNAAGLTPSIKIYDRLKHYQSRIPKDNAEFRTFALNWWGKQPSINGYWTEREHSRQWDTTELVSSGEQQRPDGEIYSPESASSIEARLQKTIDKYFKASADYEAWKVKFPSTPVGNPYADDDGDGFRNDSERIWGGDPTTASSVPSWTWEGTGAEESFSYQRRLPSLSAYKFSVFVSHDMSSWTEDENATQDVSSVSADIETVSVTPSITATDKRLFIKIEATPLD